MAARKTTAAAALAAAPEAAPEPTAPAAPAAPTIAQKQQLGATVIRLAADLLDHPDSLGGLDRDAAAALFTRWLQYLPHGREGWDDRLPAPSVMR